MSYPPGTIIRNTTAARINHWITAACFVLLTLSGLSMFHPLLSFLAFLFGSGQWARAIHPWIGCVLLVSYAGLIVQFWRDDDHRDPEGRGAHSQLCGDWSDHHLDHSRLRGDLGARLDAGDDTRVG